MSFEENRHSSSFPAVPPSLSAGDHGMRDNYDAEDTQRPTPHTISNITPYLGLRARLSQVWINRWTILLLLILVRVLIAIGSLHHDIASAKTEAMSACTGVESIGSSLASMPHYLAAGVNDLAGSGVEKAVHGLMSMLLLTITGVEELIVFYVNMLTGTYMCLITLVVSGALHAALDLIEDISGFLNTTLHGIGNDIASGISDFTSDLNKFTSGLNSIPEAFGAKGGSIPTLNVTGDLTKLQNLELPANFTQDLQQLNSSIPTFQDVQNFTDNIIRLPFEEVKSLVNGSLNFSFNRSLLPVPEKEQLTFCSGNSDISKFFDDLAEIVTIAAHVFLIVLLILAMLACIPMAIQEVRRWHTRQDRALLVKEKSFDPLDVIYIASRPYTATAGIKAAAPFKDTKRQKLTRWVIAYATSPPALVVLSLGITGLFACLCQYILLKLVVKEVPALAADVGEFADLVVNKLNNASAAWSNGTNDAILDVQNDINHNIFGWVNTTTGAINDTLNTFINKTIGELNSTFGGTVLYDPVTGLFECLIGLKVAAIQKGLTWVSDNAQVEFPELPNNTFSLGAAASLAGSKSSDSFLSSPGSVAQSDITGAVAKVVNQLADGIRNEALISMALVLVWLIILLCGVARALYLTYRPEKTRAEGGPSHAGDIPMEDINRNTVYTTSGPAPAYEPPRRDETTAGTAFPNFGEPSHARDANPFDTPFDDDEYPAEKVGYGGLREPTQDAAPQHLSSYATVEDEKS
ncbi:hypothetical protein JMJ35_003741 [Cladonia borealis]|uniref:Plasma membrane fusion protein PRM1 n=1 Tax=Cladonia borealis TaxID=184061 RepID=A0AA39V6E5_9LECA|nr:hypothetical protein JMJ35_003741 [Cladonia borealis]